MSHGEYLLSKTCEKCGRVSCVRCMKRTCFNCQRTFIDRHDHQDVEMITNTGVCVECGMLLTQKHLSEVRMAFESRFQEAHLPEAQEGPSEETA